ncbi:MAG: aminoacetone oxidase family FAD-binding enzyme, partial [Nitrospinaceae bacterium]|nr:aminoacetone oxidase family FAD-binding enzyme [Nitrospinaceae bacterium]
MSLRKTIAIIGGGAAGFFSAISAAQEAKEKGLSVDIRIFEATEDYLQKVKISGGGRCNVTHHCYDVKMFCQNYPRGSRELLSPMHKFQAQDTVEWFEKAGVHLVAEADGRMFPDTNSSATIIDCFLHAVDKFQIRLMPNHVVKTIATSASSQLKLSFREQEAFMADAILIATGSAPGGYRLADSLGHTIAERAPSLFSFKIEDPLISELQGLSFSDVTLKLTLPDKKDFKQKGAVLITHWGLSGPAILKLSA